MNEWAVTIDRDQGRSLAIACIAQIVLITESDALLRAIL